MRSNISSKDFNIYLLYPINRDDKKGLSHLLRTCIDIGEEIRAYLIDWEKMDGLPRANLYVPADHEIFVQCAYNNNFLTKENINFIDCEIIKLCDLLILLGSYNPLEKDVVEKVECTKEAEIPIYTMPDLSPAAISALKLAIKLIVKSGD